MTSGSLKRMIRMELSRRSLPEGGITDLPRRTFRTDATAWGILAFHAAGGIRKTLRDTVRVSFRSRITTAASVLTGGIPIPTGLRLLPSSLGKTRLQVTKPKIVPSVSCIETTGLHRPRQWFDAAGHDPLLKGWPWIDGTHSWIEPTALNVLALKATGHAQHERVLEAIRMILDRQLPHGGWNYGSTYVFGKEHLPMPESTGAALTGLAGMVGQEKVAGAWNIFKVKPTGCARRSRLDGPCSVLLRGSLWPANGLALVERCLANQSRYGEYDTSALCLLLLRCVRRRERQQRRFVSQPKCQQVPAIVVR